MTAPEFSRPQRIDTIGETPQSIDIEATAEERASLARRFDLVAIDALSATFAIHRQASGVIASGQVRATLTQACSVTGDPLPVTVAEDVALRFVPENDEHQPETELGTDALDTMVYSGAAIDLGEAAAETMALALDPFPRGPGAEAALREAGVLSEAEAGPFGVLAGLKAQLRTD